LSRLAVLVPILFGAIAAIVNSINLEDGTAILLEDGTALLLEA
jgi:hypothetical protein